MADELDRRELLESALEQAEEGTLEAPIEKEIETNDDPIQAENASQEDSGQEARQRHSAVVAYAKLKEGAGHECSPRPQRAA